MPKMIDSLREAARAYGYGKFDSMGRRRSGHFYLTDRRRAALARPSPALLAKFDRAWSELGPASQDVVRAWLRGEYQPRAMYRRVVGAPQRFGLRTLHELRSALAAIGVTGADE